MHSIIILFLIKGPRQDVRYGSKCGGTCGRRSVQCYVFAQSSPGQHPNDNSLWTLCTAPICVKMFHLQCYLVATVLIVQSVHRRIRIYVQIYFEI